MILSPTEFALTLGLVRTTDLNKAALQKHGHGFTAEHAPICDCMITKAIFLFDLIGWFAAHDVVGKQYNFLEREPTQLEP
jgi:hypothetical protein